MSPPPDDALLAVLPSSDDDLVARLTRFGATPVPDAVAASHVGAMTRQATTRRRRGRAALAGVAGAGLLLGSSSLAAAGVLPAPAQTAMHQTLEHIGIDVPAARRVRAPRRAPVDRPDRPAGDGAADDGSPGQRDRPARPAGHRPSTDQRRARVDRPARAEQAVRRDVARTPATNDGGTSPTPAPTTPPRTTASAPPTSPTGGGDARSAPVGDLPAPTRTTAASSGSLPPPPPDAPTGADGA